MDIREIARNILRNFFVVFTCIIFSMVFYMRFHGFDFVVTRDIFGALVIAALTSPTEIVFYSKKEQKRLEAFIRSAIHLLLVMVIGLSASFYMGWIYWGNPALVLTFVGLIVGVYIMVAMIDFYQSKKLADKLNEKLNERYHR